ncbi:MAG: hypothetical protein GX146_12590 [Myxococcales bacterium]|jgi:hypothetical protein|nr:hypothetical protein [Myxococcales bacterium]
MNRASIDVSEQLRFDLSRGRIASGAGDSVAVLPLSLLAALGDSEERIAQEGRAFGQARGREMASRIAGKTLSEFSSELAGLFALMGLGRPAIEVYGDALLVRLALPASNALEAPLQALVLAVLGGVLEALGQNAPFHVVPVEKTADEWLLFAGNETAANLMQRAASIGISLPKALTALGDSAGDF